MKYFFGKVAQQYISGGERMIKNDGNNRFYNNIFTREAWSAPTYETPEEVSKFIRENHIVGRIVTDIQTVGMGYNWTTDGITNAVGNAIDRMNEEQRKRIPNPDDFLPDNVQLTRYAEIDEPIIISFADGDSLEILADYYSRYRLSMNSIPKSIKPGTNRKTFHADRLFSDMIGAPIVSVEVTGAIGVPDFTLIYNEQQTVYLSKIAFVYDDGKRTYPQRALTISSNGIDYCEVELDDYDGSPCKVSTDEIPKIVEGYLGTKTFQYEN